ncbi:trigger factor [Intestinibacillus sp. Marseille-P6563]|uniref:trigger factor n=1 Tax=Intestinibacillus sp. Marseille-P6563 TaxID=2364792 RepID=UPI000F062854|nr:trigger factor [Intestinibacillus sp. Marseille-P6563]
MELKNIEKQEKSIVALTVEISAEEIEAAKEKAYKKNGKKITVPGFRKGKAPRKLIESLYGDGVFFEDALNICYPEVYEKAIAEAKIEPIAQADVEIQDMTDAGSVVLLCKVPVEPEVTLGEYKGIEAERAEVKVMAADVKAELERMAQRFARTETVERAAKKNDTVHIDFEGFLDGVAFEGGKGENHPLKLGSGTFIPGFEDQLIGCKAGDEKDVVVTFPEDYTAEDLAGKEAVFKCKVLSVQETITPAIDDEFAKDVSETAETLADLKKEVKERLTNAKNAEADREFEQNIIDKVVEGMQADIPDAMIEQQIDTIIRDFEYRLQMQRMNLEGYLKATGTDMATFRGMFREQAEKQVKGRLALKKVAELENIEITDEMLEDEFKKLAERYGMEIDQVKKAMPAEALMADLKIDRAIEVLRTNAKAVKKAEKEEASDKE